MIIANLEYDLTKLHGDYHWEGYTIVKFTPNGRAAFSKRGVWRNGKFGYQEVFEVQQDGKWHL